MKYEVTFAMIKPGGTQRGFIGKIITRFEDKGLNVMALKMINVSEEQAKKHYEMLSDKPFYDDLVESLMSSPCVVMALSGHHAIELVRLMAGATDPLKAQPGTIRGDFSCDIQNNIVHTSDSVENVIREMDIYFSADELVEYEKELNKWSFSN